MLLFMTTLRHPDSAMDYARCESLLGDTVRSIKQQTSSTFKVLVICNRQPHGDAFEGVECLIVDYPPAGRTPAAGREDRGMKLVGGIKRARALGADYIMTVDSDDFVHQGLATYVAEHGGPQISGWRFDKGYSCNNALTLYSRQISPKRSDVFHMRCGSSHIMRTDMLARIVADLPTDHAALAACGGDVTKRLLGDHLHYGDCFARQGQPLANLPFHGAILRMGNGENLSSKSFDGPSMILSQRMRDTFGIPHVPMARCLRDWVRDTTTKIARKLPKGGLGAPARRRG